MRARPVRSWVAALSLAAVVSVSLLAAIYVHSPDLCAGSVSGESTAEIKAALLHYATTRSVPQQSRDEIRLSYDVLRRLAPCNFLVFGLGLDSPMWSAFNAGGSTLFLEESEEWVQKVLRFAPGLHASTVRYRTRLDEADALLGGYRSEPACLPPARVRGNRRCRLALSQLPYEAYAREWDVIMIDAPRGYFASAPGRMAAIWTAAVMARARRSAGDTHVFLHDVDRRVERAYATEFLCIKFRVGISGRLWHFRIPPVSSNDTSGAFC